MNIHRWFKTLLAVMAGLLLGITLMAWGMLRLLKPGPEEWYEEMRAGPVTVSVSMPALLRIATHPIALNLMDGRTFSTRFGLVHWSATDKPNTWRAVCAPCTLPANGLGRDAVRVTRLEVTVQPDAEMKLSGHFALGEAPHALQGRWSSKLQAQRAVVDWRVVDEPVSRVFMLFAQEIPELRRAHVEGRLNVKASWQFPSREFTFKPRIDGLQVTGLGTEALMNARLSCNADDAIDFITSDESGLDLRGSDMPVPDFGRWLPRAVIAAEDQRFAEHAGFDLNEMLSAWHTNRQSLRESASGASTLSQQVAKLVYVGDERSPARKLRELLYAVELDRSLGKARVMHLYLAMAPWGDGQCGAQSASWHFFRKPPVELNAVEAAWLATLLRNPDRELALLARRGEVDRARLAWMAEQMRPMTRRERELMRRAVQRWSPPQAARAVAMSVSGNVAALGR